MGGATRLPAGEPARADGMRLLVLASAVFFAFVGRGVAEAFAVFLPEIEADFLFSRAGVTAIYASMILAVGISGPFAGMLFDRFGPLTLYASGALVLIAGTLLASVADALWQLLAALGLMIGMSSACLGIAGQTPLLGRCFPKNLGAALGVVGAATGLGVLIFAPVGQLAIDAYGWRGAYRVFAAIAVILLVPFVVLIPWNRLEAGIADAGRASRSIAGVDLGEALSDRVFWALVAAYGLTAAATYSIQPQLVSYFVSVGYRPIEAAAWLGAGGLAASAGMIGFGWISDRLGPRAAVVLSYVATSAGIAMLVSMQFAATALLLPLYAITFGLSFGSRGPVVMAMAARRWPGPALGRITGLLMTGLGVGGGGGALLGGHLHDLGGYGLMFAGASILLALGCLAFIEVFRSDRGRAA